MKYLSWAIVGACVALLIWWLTLSMTSVRITPGVGLPILLWCALVSATRQTQKRKLLVLAIIFCIFGGVASGIHLERLSGTLSLNNALQVAGLGVALGLVIAVLQTGFEDSPEHTS